MIERFEQSLGTAVHEDTARVLALPKKLGGFGFKELTVVQEATLGPIAQGLDVLVRAPTGTGKTLAYLIPILERLLYMRADPEARLIPVLVLCPTRELSLQTAAAIKQLLGLHARTPSRAFSVTTVVGGGSSTHVEQEPLADACGFLVGTPGRIHDHLRGTPGFKRRLRGVRMVVLDEVDFMLKSCLASDMAAIMGAISPKKQTIMFSATLNKAVRTVAKYSLRAGHKVIDLIRDPDVPHVTTDGMVDDDALARDATMLKSNVPPASTRPRDPDAIPDANEDVDDLDDELEPNNDFETALELADDETDDEMELFAATPKGARQYIVDCRLGDALPVLVRLADDIAARFAYAMAVYREQLEEAQSMGDPSLVLNELPKPPKILVFAPTGRYAQFAALVLRRVLKPGKDSGYEAVLELHAKKRQNYRVRVAQQFAGNSWERGVIMCSSDVAARGIDFKDVDLVVQLGRPSTRSQYIHRVGRTARAGTNGTALLLVEPEDVDLTKQMLLGLPLERPDFMSLDLEVNDDARIEDIHPDQVHQLHRRTEHSRKARELRRVAREEQAALEAALARGDIDPMEAAMKAWEARQKLNEEQEELALLEARAELEADGEEFEESDFGEAESDVDAEAEAEDEEVEGEELWSGVIERSCAPLTMDNLPPHIRERRLRTLWGQTMSTGGVSALDREKAAEASLERVLRKVLRDEELGLNAERAYVSLLGFWRSIDAQKKKTDIKRGLDSVTAMPPVPKILMGPRAVALAKALGLCGPKHDLPTPNIPLRVAERLGLVGVAGISVGEPRRYLGSETPRDPNAPQPQTRFSKSKKPAPFREYNAKQSNFKTVPRRVRTGELVQNVDPFSVGG
jgi:superfamily II DNA/RNA helicase